LSVGRRPVMLMVSERWPGRLARNSQLSMAPIGPEFIPAEAPTVEALLVGPMMPCRVPRTPAEVRPPDCEASRGTAVELPH
jgi:hypothetical protein